MAGFTGVVGTYSEGVGMATVAIGVSDDSVNVMSAFAISGGNNTMLWVQSSNGSSL